MAAAGQPDPRSVHCGPPATRAEVIARLNALTPQDRKSIASYARAMEIKFHGKANDRDAADLVHEAMLRAMDDPPTRVWYPQEVDFVTFLNGVMRSLAHAWGKGGKDTEAADTLASPVNQQAQAEAAITIEGVRHCLTGLPRQLFELMMVQGYKGPEAKKRLGITQQEYAAAYRQISRIFQREGYRK